MGDTKKYTKEEYEERIRKSQERLGYLKNNGAPQILVDNAQSHLNKITYEYSKHYPKPVLKRIK